MMKKKDVDFYIFPKQELEKLDNRLQELGVVIKCSAIWKEGNNVPILTFEDLVIK